MRTYSVRQDRLLRAILYSYLAAAATGTERNGRKWGLIGSELSDILLVTSDNPRTESPEKIIDDIEEGLPGAGDNTKPCLRITDRREAIRRAVGMAEQGDTVLIAGKGHEDYQIIGKD